MQNPVFLAFLATLGTWAMTALGAALVFFFKEINQRVLNVMLGFASGVMIAASFWSLLAPAIEMAEDGPCRLGWSPRSGPRRGLFLWIADRLIPHMHFNTPNAKRKAFHPSETEHPARTVDHTPQHSRRNGRRSSVRRPCLGRRKQCRAPCGGSGGDRHRHPELSGRSGRIDSSSKGRPEQSEMLLPWTGIRIRRTRRRRAWRTAGRGCETDPPICPCIRRRSHDLCRRRRTDTRSPAKRHRA